MKAYQLKLENDKDIPVFKNLKCKVVDVSLRSILMDGVHPVGVEENSSDWDLSDFAERLVKELNDESLSVPELKQSGYCSDVSVPKPLFRFHNVPLSSIFTNISEQIFFVDNLKYIDLLNITKERLRKGWSHELAKKLLMANGGGFNDIRSFIKNKDKNAKLSGYSDIDGQDLGELLTLDDFAHYEQTLISHGLEKTNFRLSKFVDNITKRNSIGLVGFGNPIQDFQLRWNAQDKSFGGSFSVIYNCRRLDEKITFVPEIDTVLAARELAKQIAYEQSNGKSKYCFTLGIEEVENLIKKHVAEIRFPSLNYINEKSPVESSGKIVEKHIAAYFIGRHIAKGLSNETFKDILRAHNVSMTGRKEDLLEKTQELLIRLYEKRKWTYARYFAKKRFIQVRANSNSTSTRFDIEENSLVNNTLLSMYVLKHLRGNVILDHSHENNCFELKDIAKSVVNGEVKVIGYFLRVE